MYDLKTICESHFIYIVMRNNIFCIDKQINIIVKHMYMFNLVSIENIVCNI